VAKFGAPLMPVVMLSDVTEAVEDLLEHSIEARTAGTIDVQTSAVSPVGLTSAPFLVNVFMFHIHPDGKPVTGENPTLTPQRPQYYTKPVSLYFHLTTHHNTGTATHYVEQDLLGHALATLLDHSQMDDGLFINGQQIFPNALQNRENEFEIEVLTKTDVEALNVWAGYEGATARPSLFFKVKNVRLAPDIPVGVSAPILTIGQLTLPNMGPRIFTTTTHVTAGIETSAGTVARRFAFTPAQLYLGASVNDRAIQLRGSSLDHLMGIELTLPRAAGDLVMDIDFDANPNWSLDSTGSIVSLNTDPNIEAMINAVMQTHALEPGTGQLRAKKTEMLQRDGNLIPVELPSNPVTITFNPFVDQIVEIAPRHYRIDLAGNYDLTAIAPASDHADFMRLAVGQELYLVQDSIAGLGTAEAAISAPNSIEFRLSDTADDAQPLGVQLWINDCQSQPHWIGGAP
jgi:hypothetical protein